MLDRDNHEWILEHRRPPRPTEDEPEPGDPAAIGHIHQIEPVQSSLVSGVWHDGAGSTAWGSDTLVVVGFTLTPVAGNTVVAALTSTAGLNVRAPAAMLDARGELVITSFSVAPVSGSGVGALYLVYQAPSGAQTGLGVVGMDGSLVALGLKLRCLNPILTSPVYDLGSILATLVTDGVAVDIVVQIGFSVAYLSPAYIVREPA